MDLTPQPTDSPQRWLIARQGRMRLPAVIYADSDLIAGMHRQVFEQWLPVP